MHRDEQTGGWNLARMGRLCLRRCDDNSEKVDENVLPSTSLLVRTVFLKLVLGLYIDVCLIHCLSM